jgi:hypothetical protein
MFFQCKSGCNDEVIRLFKQYKAVNVSTLIRPVPTIWKTPNETRDVALKFIKKII